MSEIHIIPTLEDNYSYVIEAGTNVILVDCGEAQPVIDFLNRNNLTATHLFITHHHGDHIAGIPDLKNAYSGLEILAPEKDLFRISNINYGLKDQEKFKVGDISFECIETPGHTLNHLCFYVSELNSVFTGDALFASGCGRLFEGTPADLFSSMEKLKTLPDTTQIYCGHEYTLKNLDFSLSIEPDNQFLLNRRDEVEKLRQENKPSLPVTLGQEKQQNLFLKTDTVEKIAQLRQLRDQF